MIRKQTSHFFLFSWILFFMLKVDFITATNFIKILFTKIYIIRKSEKLQLFCFGLKYKYFAICNYARTRNKYMTSKPWWPMFLLYINVRLFLYKLWSVRYWFIYILPFSLLISLSFSFPFEGISKSVFAYENVFALVLCSTSAVRLWRGEVRFSV